MKSSGMRYVGDSVMEFEKGDLILLGSKLPHCWKNAENQREPAESIVVQWNLNVLGEGWLEKEEFIAIQRLLGTASRGMKFKSATARRIGSMLEDLLNLQPFEKMLSLLKILNTLALDEKTILLSGDNFTTKSNHNANKKIDIVQNYVNEHHQRQISLKEIANLVAMSEETFCRFFKRTFNKSFFTFLNEFKIKLACKQLIESNKQVSEIAFSCGYESLPYFYRQFKKFMHCSPLVYRKKYAGVYSV